MRLLVWLRIISLGGLVAISACGGRPAMRPIWLLPRECEVLSRPEKLADTVTVALLDDIEIEYAPWPRNNAERLFFNHFYETLVTVDCLGRVHPRLARSWRSERGGKRWVFELARGVRFWDGSVLRAQDVVASWQDALTISSIIDSAHAESERALRIYFKKPHRKFPKEIASCLFAVAKATDYTRWPLGTGPYRLVSSWADSRRNFKLTYIAEPAFSRRKPVIKFLEYAPGDARDLIESGIDLLITRDPSVIEYASIRDEFSAASLPWDKTYVLLSPLLADKIPRSFSNGGLPRDFLEKLAEDAVRSDARGSEPLRWWGDSMDCSGLILGPEGDFSLHVPGKIKENKALRILFRANDEVAKDLCERIVALLSAEPGASKESTILASALCTSLQDSCEVTARGVSSDEFAGSIERGDEFAYILSLPRKPLDPCLEAGEFINKVPWLSRLGVDFSRAVLLLVDTRAHVIARKNRFGLVKDSGGNLLLTDGKRERR